MDDKARPAFRVETIRGEPYYVGERTLIPVARVVSYSRARATIGNRQTGGWAGAFVQVTPVAVLELTPEGERRIPITDNTSRSLLGMMFAGVLIILLFGLIRSVARRKA